MNRQRTGGGGRGHKRARNEKRPPGAKATAGRVAGRIARVLLSTGRLLAVAVVSGLVIWSGVLAYGHATSAEYFAVEDATVTGASRLERGEVLETAGFAAGMNVFTVDTEEMTRALESHPWIAEASVKRSIPRNVSIEIRERRPEALVLFDSPYLVDDTGEVFKRWTSDDPVQAPVITGFTREQFILDGEGVLEGVREAIAFARRYRSSGLERIAPLAEVHREVDGGLTVVVGDDPFRVKLGAGPYRRKLERLAMLLDRMSRDGLRPAMIYLDNEVRPDRVTVKIKGERRARPDVRAGSGAGDEKTQSKI